jgi:hypothetical protein
MRIPWHDTWYRGLPLEYRLLWAWVVGEHRRGRAIRFDVDELGALLQANYTLPDIERHFRHRLVWEKGAGTLPTGTDGQLELFQGITRRTRMPVARRSAR